jgi:uridine kinase
MNPWLLKNGPYLIGIAGPSCAGKSELAKALKRRIPDTLVLPIDAYYRGLEQIPLSERKKRNFDDPDIIEHELLISQVQQLASGEAVDRPSYSFESYCRAPATTRVYPQRCIVVEGLFALYWPALRGLLDLRIFISAPRHVCFDRRLVRDVNERRRSPESVQLQFEETVWPSAERFVLPTEQHANVVLCGESPLEDSVNEILQIETRRS